jgi:hypothetical protein
MFVVPNGRRYRWKNLTGWRSVPIDATEKKQQKEIEKSKRKNKANAGYTPSIGRMHVHRTL